MSHSSFPGFVFYSVYCPWKLITVFACFPVRRMELTIFCQESTKHTPNKKNGVLDSIAPIY